MQDWALRRRGIWRMARALRADTVLFNGDPKALT